MIMFDIINNSNEKVEELDTLEAYMNYVVERLKLEKAIFNFILVDEEEIHRLNKDYRGVSDARGCLYLYPCCL